MKLNDFGFCTLLENNQGKSVLKSFKGTEGYMAPEMFKKKGYNGKQVDIFALAVCLFMMVTGCQPFGQAKNKDQFYKLITANKPEQYWKIFDKVATISPELKNLLFRMMCADPEQRMTLEDIVMDPWAQGPVPSHEEVVMEFMKESIKLQSSTTTNSTTTTDPKKTGSNVD